MKRIFISETINKAEEQVKVAGWVHARRDHGKLIFIDLRDRSGLLQVVFGSQKDALYGLAQQLLFCLCQTL